MFVYPGLTFYMGNVEISIVKLVLSGYDTFICEHAHAKNIYEMHYIISGKGHMLINNDRIKYPLKPGTMDIIGPGVTHAHFPEKGYPIRDYCFGFSVKETTNKTRAGDNVIKKVLDTPFWLAEGFQDSEHYFLEIMEEAGKPRLGGEMVLQSLFKCLLVHLARNMVTALEPMRPMAKPAVNLTINRTQIIDDSFFEYGSAITLEILADKLECSTRHLSRYIKEYYGKSFHDLKNDFRMAQAAAELYESDISISQLSDKLGFSSYVYFEKVFKKYYKMSPSAYRNDMKEE